MDKITLYRALLKTSKQIPTYNFREYAIRKVKDSFRQNENTKEFLLDAENQLAMLKRQVIVQKLYNPDKLVIETINY
jgi:hypothetical protein